ncbi:MAG: hypothetical protein ACFCVD_07655 [Nodosilinea sp.]
MAYLTQISRPLAGALATLGVLSATPIALAQSTGADPTAVPTVDTGTGFTSPEGSSAGLDDSGSVLDLIHRAVLMNGLSISDFNRQQRQHIESEANNFRTLQQEAIRQQAAQDAAAEGSETVAE